jgi:hypothetical protein
MLESTHTAQLPIFRTVLLLASLLASGFLAAFVLFDSRAERAPAVTPTASPAMQRGAGVPSADTWIPAPPVPRKLRLRAIRTARSSSR